MNDTYLAHHGILGQKWGKKNGPPYPLDFSKLSAEERKQAKEESISKGDVKTANAHNNRSYYSTQELNELLNRFDLETRLQQKVSSLDRDKIASGLKRIDSLANSIGTVSKLVGNVGGGIESINRVKTAIDKATGNSDNKKSYAYNKTKLSSMLKNPDAYSDEEWNKAKNRIQSINNVKNTSELLNKNSK